MNLLLALKLLHILSAMVLVGVGLGTAFYFFRAWRAGDPKVLAAVAADVVRADLWFTTPAGFIQPLTGVAMMQLSGWTFEAWWLRATLLLYAVSSAAWLPVLWLQVRVRDLAREAAITGQPLPPLAHRYGWWWFALGWPGFGAVLAIYVLMVFKPG